MYFFENFEIVAISTEKNNFSMTILIKLTFISFHLPKPNNQLQEIFLQLNLTFSVNLESTLH